MVMEKSKRYTKRYKNKKFLTKDAGLSVRHLFLRRLSDCHQIRPADKF